MGKPTGFLDYERNENKSAEPLSRITNFNEFHKPLSLFERQEQGARCMNCGVPFCQSGMMLNNMATGCPLHNLIPEWNDEIYNGNWDEALSRLLKTNPFPEFTGRVCPALCEAACTEGLNKKPVTIHDNELAIIESGFKRGKVVANPPALRTDKKIAVIGSGPSGLSVAERLNRRGHNVTVFEREDRIGGLLMYGIPNMKLQKEVIDRRVNIMKEEGVVFVTNADFGKNLKPKDVLKDFDAVVLCCGAKKPRDLNVPGRDAKNIYFAVDFLTANTKSLLNSGFADKKYFDPKGKNVVIVGGGDTGNDCVGTCIRHGCKSVTQLEMMPKPPVERAENNPWPQFPKILKTDYGQQEAIAVFGKDPRVYKTTVKEIICDKNKNIKAIKTVMVEFRDGKLCEIENSEKTIDADMLIIAAGFLGAEDYVLKSAEVETTKRNTVQTPIGKYQTSVPKIFASGDVRRGQSLVVWAIAEGRECAKEVDGYLMGYTNLV